MDAGSITKTAASTALVGPARAEVAAARNAAPTSLAPEMTVQQPPEGASVQLSIDGAAYTRAAIDKAMRDVIQRNITIDPKSHEVIYQVLDENSGAVVRQYPDETLLKLRTFAREMRDRVQDEKAPDDAPTIERIA